MIKENLNKFNIKKQSLITHSKNERGAGRKCVGKTKVEKTMLIYLEEGDFIKIKEHIKTNKLKGYSSFVRSLLREKGIIK